MGVNDIDSHQYPEFSVSIKARFAAAMGIGLPLFTTDADGLFDVFLANLPEEARQHYTCNACRHFVNRFGGLVYIAERGDAVPVIWDGLVAPEFFCASVLEMKKAVLKSKVTGVFLSGDAVLGTPVTGEWEHMSVTLPQRMVFQSLLKTAGQMMSEKREDHRILNSALQEYSAEAVNQAVTLLKSEALYRSDKVLGVAEWFHTLHEKLDGVKDSKKRAHLKWLAVATAPSGFCHVKSSMIGTLLDDLTAGLPIDAVSRKFKEKMNPLQYMRPQAAPTQGNIEQAEKIVEKLGIANSLKRRYARFEEIPQFLWRRVQKTAEKQAQGVFGHLAPKGKPTPESDSITLPDTKMTWEKFRRTVLPEAENIEAKVDSPSRFMALVTAADPEAPNILRWGNPFSWYYRVPGSYGGWGMTAGAFVKVKGVTETPNLWGDTPVTHAGRQIFFLLEGCRDVTCHPGGGLFPELLKSELHEIRSTLEAHAKTALIDGADNADACGAGYKDGVWNLMLKVSANNSTRLIQIDRWD